MYVPEVDGNRIVDWDGNVIESARESGKLLFLGLSWVTL